MAHQDLVRFAAISISSGGFSCQGLGQHHAMKRIFLALIGSALIAFCAAKGESPKSETSAPSQTEQGSEMSLDKIINQPYKADQ